MQSRPSFVTTRISVSEWKQIREAIAWIADSDLFLPLKLIENIPEGMRATTVSSEVYLITNSAAPQSMSMYFSKEGENKKFAELSPFSAIG